MAYELFRLTDRIVRSLKSPGYHADGGGLYLQISNAGARSWIYRYSLRKRTRDMGLGALRFVTLAEARARAAECRALVGRGIDPIEYAKSAAPSIDAVQAAPANPAVRQPTFREFAEGYIEARSDTWRNGKHRDQWSTSLAHHAYPIIGDMALADIDTPDVLRVLEPIWREKSETASRVRGRIERILAAASVRGLRPATNPAAWAGHLREALPPKKKAVAFAALSYADVPAFLILLANRQGVAARALEFTILTASRSGAVRKARWSEIDAAARLWTAPGENMKAGRPHGVPLCDQAMAIVNQMKPLRDLAGGYLFPGAKHARPLSDLTLSKLVHAMGFEVTVHGFRASFKTWAEQETDHPNVVIEAALAHIVGDKAERAYMRGNWLVKRRALMNDWGAFCNPGRVLASNRSAAIAPFMRRARSS